IVSGDNAVKVPSSDLSGMSMKIMADRGPQDKCQVITNESGPFGLRDVSAWHASSDALFVYGWPADITSGTQRCEIPVAVFIPGEDSGTGVAIPLWSRTLVDSRNIVEDNLVLRHGSGIPISPVDGKPYTQLVPKVQCDWEKAGFGKRQRKGGCINLGVSRVFVMSKSRNANFLEVIKHIEKALNPSVNAGTAPPKRPGHNWADPMHPPVRTSTVSPVSKVIPGNWARGGAALTKVNSDGGKYNRSFFQNIEFITDRGTADEKRWPDLPLAPDGTRPKPTSSQLIGVNHCKYYFWDEYKTATKWDYGVPRAGWLQCDEYPFASTKEGAGTKDGNYSLQAVPTNHNRDHGEALDSFYADYRVVTGDQFWVKIVS
ncbi:NucA/NucB deoxyribonuclease domain-containing protein, partial [Nonomuraea sp. NPDC055795]